MEGPGDLSMHPSSSTSVGRQGSTILDPTMIKALSFQGEIGLDLSHPWPHLEGFFGPVISKTSVIERGRTNLKGIIACKRCKAKVSFNTYSLYTLKSHYKNVHPNYIKELIAAISAGSRRGRTKSRPFSGCETMDMNPKRMRQTILESSFAGFFGQDYMGAAEHGVADGDMNEDPVSFVNITDAIEFPKPGAKMQVSQQLGEILEEFLRRQEHTQKEFWEHQERLYQHQLEAEKEYRQQDFDQNMTMMREIIGVTLNSSEGPTLDDEALRKEKTARSGSSLPTISTASSTTSTSTGKSPEMGNEGRGKRTVTMNPDMDNERPADNEFPKPAAKKQKCQQLGEILDEFLKRQEQSQKKFWDHQERLYQSQLEAEKEYRQQDFTQNMTMMKEIIGFMLNSADPLINLS
ncbi:uncharacterized protein LOC143021949 isoform X2 [Oratosquilla oratoria]|uniref:uncharacterized protein LOC143021949 isoform X2 n=1 Tax=Oratosquilla oratoria TaxID=337810 RepID=UPI003F759BE1